MTLSSKREIDCPHSNLVESYSARDRAIVKIAFTHNLRLTDSEEEAEFDTVETVDAIAQLPTTPGGGGEMSKPVTPPVIRKVTVRP